MKWIKRIFISIGILGLICLGGYIVYNVAYAIGEAGGYDKGYNAGYSIGQKAGYSLGKTDGYSSGKTDGYSLGKQDGYSEGYDSGKATGYEEGYDEGVEASLGHGYTLRDPTYRETVTFLRQDKTDENEFVEDTYGVYVCSHFARDVSNNAEEEGLRCAFVELRYSDGGHSIIAFDTIDRGLIFFEPQFDDVVKVVISQSYSQLNNYQNPDYDDIIEDILVIW